MSSSVYWIKVRLHVSTGVVGFVGERPLVQKPDINLWNRSSGACTPGFATGAAPEISDVTVPEVVPAIYLLYNEGTFDH